MRVQVPADRYSSNCSRRALNGGPDRAEIAQPKLSKTLRLSVWRTSKSRCSGFELLANAAIRSTVFRPPFFCCADIRISQPRGGSTLALSELATPSCSRSLGPRLVNPRLSAREIDLIRE